MTETLTIRLTAQRTLMLNRLKKRLRVKKNIDAIDIALQMGCRDDVDYISRIEKAAGCLSADAGAGAVARIRSLRGDT
jgi:hypothetical protein